MQDVVSIAIIANDLPGGVDAPRPSEHRTGKVEGGEVRPDGKKSMLSAASVNVHSGDVAKGIDVVRLGNGGTRKIEAEALPVRAHEPVLNRRSNARKPPPDEIATGIDTQYGRVSGTGEVYFRKSAILPSETMLGEQVAVGIEEMPRTDDGTGLINPKSLRLVAPGKSSVVTTPLLSRNP